MFLTAEKVSAEEALRVGLVDALVDDPVEEACDAWAFLGKAWLMRSPSAQVAEYLISQSKQVLRFAQDDKAEGSWGFR